MVAHLHARDFNDQGRNWLPGGPWISWKVLPRAKFIASFWPLFSTLLCPPIGSAAHFEIDVARGSLEIIF